MLIILFVKLNNFQYFARLSFSHFVVFTISHMQIHTAIAKAQTDWRWHWKSAFAWTLLTFFNDIENWVAFFSLCECVSVCVCRYLWFLSVLGSFSFSMVVNEILHLQSTTRLPKISSSSRFIHMHSIKMVIDDLLLRWRQLQPLLLHSLHSLSLILHLIHTTLSQVILNNCMNDPFRVNA